MRVITGSARGRVLEAVEGLEVRPTTDKVKEAVFSSIQFEVEGAKVLDLFCGSGQMGIEALSRGAGFCVFVDSSKRSVEVTKKNLMSTNLFKSSRVAAMDYKAFLMSTKEVFDIAFMDPPYSKGLINEALTLMEQHMSESGVILCEHDRKDELPSSLEKFVKVKEYNYGRIAVSAYRLKSEEE